jgi:hypothetical protein
LKPTVQAPADAVAPRRIAGVASSLLIDEPMIRLSPAREIRPMMHSFARMRLRASAGREGVSRVRAA